MTTSYPLAMQVGGVQRVLEATGSKTALVYAGTERTPCGLRVQLPNGQTEIFDAVLVVVITEQKLQQLMDTASLPVEAPK